MKITVKELAAMVGGRLEGNGEVAISAARALNEAGPGAITFLDNPKHLDQLRQSKASAAVVAEAVADADFPLIRIADPLMAFVTIFRHFHAQPELPPHGIDARASVHSSAKIGEDASVMPFAVIGAQTVIGARCRVESGAVIGRGCILADDVTIHANSVLYDGTRVGNRVTIHASTVIGADGFGYRIKDGKHVKIPQLGTVEIGDDVEIGAGVTIDRSTFGVTRIGEGTKIDNQVQIGHNCRIGKHNILVGQCGVAGSCTTGAYVVIAGRAAISDHITIGTGAVIGGQSGVTKDVQAGQRVLGFPAGPEKMQKRILMTMRELPRLRMDLLRVKRHLGLDKSE